MDEVRISGRNQPVREFTPHLMTLVWSLSLWGSLLHLTGCSLLSSLAEAFSPQFLIFTDTHQMKSPLKCVFFKTLTPNRSLHVAGLTLRVHLKIQQQLSRSSISLKRQAATKIVYGPENSF